MGDKELLIANLKKTIELSKEYGKEIEIIQDDGSQERHFIGEISSAEIENDRINIVLFEYSTKNSININIEDVVEDTVQAVTCYKYYISRRPDPHTTIINFVSNEPMKCHLFEQYETKKNSN